MSFTLGTLVSCNPQNAATFSILTSITSATKSQKVGSVNTTHALLNKLNILKANPNPPRPSEMPARLAREVLDHDAAQDDELSVDAVEDAVVGEVEAVGDFDGEPGCDGFCG